MEGGRIFDSPQGFNGRRTPGVLTPVLRCCAQGMQASLELLPMWAGVDSDVALFASGDVLDDDGEWAGGQSLGAEAGA